MHTHTSEPLLTPEEVARTLCLEVGTLAAWRTTGRQILPYIKLGGRIRYRAQDVAALIDEHLQTA